MIYSIKDPPEYIDTSKSKNILKRNIISFIVFIIIFSIVGYDISFDFAAMTNDEIGLCLVISLLVMLVPFGILCLIFPNEKKQKNADIFKDYYNFPDDLYRVRLQDGIDDIPDVEMAAWLKNNDLHISAAEYKNDFGEIIIPTKNIVFFVRDGDFYTKTVLNRDGRLIGGLIAGPTGFLVGTNTSAETVEVDKRTTILYLECGGEEQTLFFDSATYNNFMSMLPQFEYKKVVSKSSIKESKNSIKVEKSPKIKNTSDNLEQIKQLKELLDIGAISQEEYDLKKQELLSKI